MAERWRIRAVVMDLSETDRGIVRRYFDSALVVADGFHVVRLIHHFIEAWKASIRSDERVACSSR